MPGTDCVIVVGAGIWGCAIALELENAGFQVELLDAGHSEAGSRVAAGLVRPDSLERFRQRPLWWGAEHQRASYAWLERWSNPVQEMVFSHREPQGRMRSGLRRVDLGQLLGAVEPRCGEVLRISRQHQRWQLGYSLSERVVLALGAFTDTLLRRSGLPILGVVSEPGTALIGPGSMADGEVETWNYRLDGDSRTRQVHRLAWAEGLVRCGDSHGSARLEGQRQMLERRLASPPSLRLHGLRPRLPQLFVDEIAPGLVVASGAGRNGLLSAGGVSLRVRQLLTCRPQR